MSLESKSTVFRVIILQLSRGGGMLWIAEEFALNNHKTFRDKMCDKVQALVFDNGSVMTKAGFASNNNPK